MYSNKDYTQQIIHSDNAQGLCAGIRTKSVHDISRLAALGWDRRVYSSIEEGRTYHIPSPTQSV